MSDSDDAQSTPAAAHVTDKKKAHHKRRPPMEPAPEHQTSMKKGKTVGHLQSDHKLDPQPGCDEGIVRGRSLSMGSSSTSMPAIGEVLSKEDRCDSLDNADASTKWRPEDFAPKAVSTLRNADKTRFLGKTMPFEDVPKQKPGQSPRSVDGDAAEGLLPKGAQDKDICDRIDAMKLLISEEAGVAHYHVELGNLLTQVHRFAAASRSIKRALDLDPESPSAHYNMAVCLHTRFLTLQRMKNDTRYEYLTTGKKKCSALPNSVKKNMEEGENEWSNRDRELIGDILRYYRQSLTLNPSLFVAHDNIGLIMEMMGKTTKAKNEYVKALRINPFDPVGLGHLARIACETDDWRAGISMYGRLADMTRDNMHRLHIGDVYLSKGFPHEAADEYRKTLLQYPGSCVAQRKLNQARVNIAAKKAKTMLQKHKSAGTLSKSFQQTPMAAYRMSRMQFAQQLEETLVEKMGADNDFEQIIWPSLEDQSALNMYLCSEEAQEVVMKKAPQAVLDAVSTPQTETSDSEKAPSAASSAIPKSSRARGRDDVKRFFTGNILKSTTMGQSQAKKKGDKSLAKKMDLIQKLSVRPSIYSASVCTLLPTRVEKPIPIHVGVPPLENEDELGPMGVRFAVSPHLLDTELEVIMRSQRSPDGFKTAVYGAAWISSTSNSETLGYSVEPPVVSGCTSHILYPNMTLFAATHGIDQLSNYASRRAASRAANGVVTHLNKSILSQGMSILSEKEFISSLSVAHDSVVVYPVNVDGVFDSAPATLLAGGVFPLESRPNEWLFACVTVGNFKAFHIERMSRFVTDVTRGNAAPFAWGGSIGAASEHLPNPDLRNCGVYSQNCEDGDLFLVLSSAAWHSLMGESIANDTTDTDLDRMLTSQLRRLIGEMDSLDPESLVEMMKSELPQPECWNTVPEERSMFLQQYTCLCVRVGRFTKESCNEANICTSKALSKLYTPGQSVHYTPIAVSLYDGGDRLWIRWRTVSNMFVQPVLSSSMLILVAKSTDGRAPVSRTPVVREVILPYPVVEESAVYHPEDSSGIGALMYMRKAL